MTNLRDDLWNGCLYVKVLFDQDGLNITIKDTYLNYARLEIKESFPMAKMNLPGSNLNFPWALTRITLSPGEWEWRRRWRRKHKINDLWNSHMCMTQFSLIFGEGQNTGEMKLASICVSSVWGRSSSMTPQRCWHCTCAAGAPAWTALRI